MVLLDSNACPLCRGCIRVQTKAPSRRFLRTDFLVGAVSEMPRYSSNKEFELARNARSLAEFWVGLMADAEQPGSNPTWWSIPWWEESSYQTDYQLSLHHYIHRAGRRLVTVLLRSRREDGGRSFSQVDPDPQPRVGADLCVFQGSRSGNGGSWFVAEYCAATFSVLYSWHASLSC
jgi:hypothetical protein